MQLLLTGQPVDAATAAAWGLVTEVVPSDQLDARVRSTAELIASKSPTAIAMGKRGFYAQAAQPDLDQAYATASQVMVDNMLQPDAEEGIRAFLQKRAPRWEA
jgi:enoyl-CoA hydratase/carnithine racemase